MGGLEAGGLITGIFASFLGLIKKLQAEHIC